MPLITLVISDALMKARMRCTTQVRMLFSETYYNAANLRKFNVSINDVPVLANFDIWTNSSGKNKANQKIFDIGIAPGMHDMPCCDTLIQPLCIAHKHTTWPSPTLHARCGALL